MEELDITSDNVGSAVMFGRAQPIYGEEMRKRDHDEKQKKE